MKSIKKYIFLFVVSFVFPVLAYAQEHLALTTIKLNPFTDGQFESALGTLRSAMNESGTPFYWLVAESQSGEAHYLFAQPYSSFSVMDIDVDSGIGAALGQDEIETLVSNLQSSISSASTARYVGRPDLSRSNPEESNAVPDAVIIIKIQPANGMADELEAYMTQVIEATDATAPNVFWNTMSPTFGANHYIVVVTVPEWEDLDTPAKSVNQRIIEHFGERRGERMVENSAGYIANLETNLYKTRPDLARQPVE